MKCRCCVMVLVIGTASIASASNTSYAPHHNTITYIDCSKRGNVSTGDHPLGGCQGVTPNYSKKDKATTKSRRDWQEDYKQPTIDKCNISYTTTDSGVNTPCKWEGDDCIKMDHAVCYFR